MLFPKTQQPSLRVTRLLCLWEKRIVVPFNRRGNRKGFKPHEYLLILCFYVVLPFWLHFKLTFDPALGSRCV